MNKRAEKERTEKKRKGKKRTEKLPHCLSAIQDNGFPVDRSCVPAAFHENSAMPIPEGAELPRMDCGFCPRDWDT